MSAGPRLALALCLLVAPAVCAAQALKWNAAPAAQTVTPAAAPAQGVVPQRSGDYLQRMDANGDGKISVVEYQDWLSYAFDGMDRNRDGVLTPDEQPGGRGKPITRDEHRARLAERFKRQDIDRNGFLDAKELSAPPQGK